MSKSSGNTRASAPIAYALSYKVSKYAVVEVHQRIASAASNRLRQIVMDKQLEGYSRALNNSNSALFLIGLLRDMRKKQE